MPRVTGTLALDDVYATFSAKAVQDDYGVPRSPTFTVYEDIKLTGLTILEVEIPLKAVPDALEAKLLEEAEDLEWEPDE